MKKKSFQPIVSQRVEAPLTGTIKGKPALMCPWCKPTHILIPGQRAACGTELQVRAVQPVYKARYAKDMTCAKCGKGGGEMVPFANAFAHISNCMPGVAVLSEKPNFSRLASLVYRLPERMKNVIEKRTGKAMPVDEVTEDGTRTGKILGHFFWKDS
jgi:hypothetical protein